MAIDRRPLRDQIRDEVLARLERGEFTAGADVNEARLAAELGVSRTPLREALVVLEQEGVLQSRPGRGFRFAPISPEEFAELTPVIAVLEAFALETSDPAHLRKIAFRLRQMAEEFSVSVAEHEVIARHDDAFHDLLISGCPNERLTDLLTSLKAGLRRYEHLSLADTAALERSADEHRHIADCLVNEDLPGAVAGLRQNWASGTTRMLQRLAKH